MERPVLRTERGKCRKVSKQRHLYDVRGNTQIKIVELFLQLEMIYEPKFRTFPDAHEYPPKELFQDAQALLYHLYLMYSFLMN